MKEERKDVNFVILNKEFLHCIRFFSPQVVSVWTTLLRYWFFKKGSKTKRVNEWVCPSKASLALRTGIDEDTVEKCIKELKIMGFIKKVEQRFSDENRAWKSNYYFLDDHPTITQAKLDELRCFRNVRRAKQPLDSSLFEYELYGDPIA